MCWFSYQAQNFCGVSGEEGGGVGWEMRDETQRTPGAIFVWYDSSRFDGYAVGSSVT